MNKRHRGWILSLCLCFLFAAVSFSLFRFAALNMSENRVKLETERDNFTRILQQLINDAETAKKLGSDIKPEDYEKYLKPENLSQITSRFERLASMSRLSSFSYTASPEQVWGGNEYIGLYKSILTVQAEAPHDVYIYRFLKRLQNILPGVARITKLGVERSSSVLSAANLRFSAEIEWIKNGEIKP